MLTVWLLLLGALAILVLVAERKGLIEKHNSQFVAAVSLSGIALVNGIYSLCTKSAIFRGNMAEKKESPVLYYGITATFIITFIFFGVMALRIYIGSH